MQRTLSGSGVGLYKKRRPSLIADMNKPTDEKKTKKRTKQQGTTVITRELILLLIELVNETFEDTECKGLPLIRIKNNKFLVGTQCLKLLTDPNDEMHTINIIDDLKLAGITFHDYLIKNREPEVDNIVAAMNKTGYTYQGLVQHYLRVNGAPEKVIEDVATKLNVKEWEKLMEECGYRM